MKALVATVNSLLFVDLQSRQVKVVESNRPEYYGISWWKNSDTLVLSHSGLANDTLVDLESYITSEKGYLSFDHRHSTLFLSQPHQLLCAANGWIIVTNTGRNCVTLYDPTNGFYKDIRINDIHWDRLGKDNACGEHFNSVYLKNDRLYVLAHRFKKNSHVLEFSYPDCTLLERHELKQRSGLHNIWVDDAGNMIACHSEAGELIDVKSNETIWAARASNYSRGLAATQEFIIVGDSAITHTREDRKTSPSVLWLIDRKTFNTMDYFNLGPYGSVHEVRLLDTADEAHHGCLFSGLDNLEKQLATTKASIAEHNPEKLRLSQQWKTQSHLLQPFNCILNSWMLDEKEWLTPKNDRFTLGILKQPFHDYFTASFDYTFQESALSLQHISFIIGYQGPDDTNMLAILISYNKQKTTINLWQNRKNNWELREVLVRNAPQTGKLSITRTQNQLTIQCDSGSVIKKKFNTTELQGALGMRSHGAQFKNFVVSENRVPDNTKKFRLFLEKVSNVFLQKS